jgi:hypothetical protein
MALKYAERVKESTSNKPATSATAFSLGGAKAGFRSFAAGVGTTHKCVYVAQEVDGNGNPSGAWEVQVGAVTAGSPDTLSRDHLISSSTGSFIDWSAAGENASPDVFVTFPAGMGEGLFQPIIYPSTDPWWRPGTAPGTLISGAAAGVNRIHVQPFFIPRPMVLKGLRAHLTGGAAAGRNLYLAFYRARGQANQAMDRVAASAELDGSTNGEKADTSISQFIEPGLYFSALSAESNLMSFAGVAATAQLGSLSAMTLGVNDASMTSSVGVAGYYDDGPVYGVPPSTITPDSKPTTHQPVVEAKFELP